MVVYQSIRPFVMLHRMGKGRNAGSIVSAAGADHTTAGSINDAGGRAGNASLGGSIGSVCLFEKMYFYVTSLVMVSI